MTEVLELSEVDVLEFLDHKGGTVAIAELARRGTPATLIRTLETRELVTCDDERVQLTDAGAGRIGLTERRPRRPTAPPSEPTPAAGSEEPEKPWTPGRQCEHCEKDFHPHPATPHQRFCSAECRKNHKTEEEPMPTQTPARSTAVKPPPSDPGDLDRYIGALGRLAMIEAPPTEVIERLERVLELDGKVRGAS